MTSQPAMLSSSPAADRDDAEHGEHRCASAEEGPGRPCGEVAGRESRPRRTTVGVAGEWR